MPNVLVLANETIGGKNLLDAIRARHGRGARAALATKKAKGLPIGNPEALRQARKGRAR